MKYYGSSSVPSLHVARSAGASARTGAGASVPRSALAQALARAKARWRRQLAVVPLAANAVRDDRHLHCIPLHFSAFSLYINKRVIKFDLDFSVRSYRVCSRFTFHVSFVLYVVNLLRPEIYFCRTNYGFYRDIACQLLPFLLDSFRLICSALLYRTRCRIAESYNFSI